MRKIVKYCRRPSLQLPLQTMMNCGAGVAGFHAGLLTTSGPMALPRKRVEVQVYQAAARTFCLQM